MRHNIRIYWLCPGFEYDQPETGGLFYLYMMIRAFKEHFGTDRVTPLNLVKSFEKYSWVKKRLYANYKYLVYFIKIRQVQGQLVMVDSRTHSLLLLPILYLRFIRNVSIGVTSYHIYYTGANRKGAKGIVDQFSERVFLSCASFIITISQATKQDLEQLIIRYKPDKCPIYLVEPGVKTAGLSNIEKHTNKDKKTGFSILYVGNCSDERKGLVYLIQAMAYLPNLDVVLTLVGKYDKTSEYYHQLNIDIDQFKLREQITFTGRVSEQELDILYHAADIFVLPSLLEGYGIVLAEAMSYGLPIVATNVGSIPEVVKDAVNAILVPPRNPSALAKAILSLINDHTLYNQMRNRNIEISNNKRSWEIVGKELVDVVSTEYESTHIQ